MSNEFGRETHWQIVRSDPNKEGKEYHARCVSNYRIILYSPQYLHKRDARRAGEIAAPEWFANKTPLEVDERSHKTWWIATGFFDQGGRKVAGPYATFEEAITARREREAAEPMASYWIDSEAAS